MKFVQTESTVPSQIACFYSRMFPAIGKEGKRRRGFTTLSNECAHVQEDDTVCVTVSNDSVVK